MCQQKPVPYLPTSSIWPGTVPLSRVVIGNQKCICRMLQSTSPTLCMSAPDVSIPSRCPGEASVRTAKDPLHSQVTHLQQDSVYQSIYDTHEVCGLFGGTRRHSTHAARCTGHSSIMSRGNDTSTSLHPYHLQTACNGSS